MNFRTEVQLDPAPFQIGHGSEVCCLGSCFANEVAQLLKASLFPTTSNPFGIVFNPVSLCEQIERALANHRFTSSEFFEHQSLWRHFLIQASLASSCIEESITSANNSLESLSTSLRSAKFLILTLGTAWAYEELGNSKIVAHNHKLPLNGFEKKLLTPSAISDHLISAIKQVVDVNPDIRVILTVSPVKHLRDGLHENNLSKAALLLAANRIVNEFAQATYFPAYEILVDELRDYRFYSSDMAHPSSQAIEYIWSRFQQFAVSEDSRKTIAETESILRFISHRPNQPASPEYRAQKDRMKERIEKLEQRGLAVSSIIEQLNRLP